MVIIGNLNLRHILSYYTHYSWLIVLDLQSFITICPWLPLVAIATINLVGDNREFEVFLYPYSWLIVLDLQSFITICPWLYWLSLATIDLVGDNREFEVFRHILSCYTHYSWLIVLDLQSFITICPWLLLVAHSNH